MKILLVTFIITLTLNSVLAGTLRRDEETHEELKKGEVLLGAEVPEGLVQKQSNIPLGRHEPGHQQETEHKEDDPDNGDDKNKHEKNKHGQGSVFVANHVFGSINNIGQIYTAGNKKKPTIVHQHITAQSQFAGVDNNVGSVNQEYGDKYQVGEGNIITGSDVHKEHEKDRDEDNEEEYDICPESTEMDYETTTLTEVDTTTTTAPLPVL